MKNLLLTLTIMMAAATCLFAQSERISGIQWTLEYASGRTVTNSSAYFEINGDQNRFTGNTGCNRMFGTLTINGEQIMFSNVGSTKMMCKLPAGSVPENSFLRALDKAVKYSAADNKLHIYDRKGRTIMRFYRLTKQAPVDPVSGLTGREK